MNKYEKEVLQAQLNNEKAVLKQLEEMYKEALLEINSKIEMLMSRQDADMQHVIYQAEYQKALKTQVQAILENLQANEFETISEYLAQSYEEGFLGTMYNLQGQGIPLVFPIDQKQAVAAIMNETKLSTTLYAALDMKELQKKIAGEISRGIAGGQLYTEIARNIAGYARIPKNNAMRIVRTEAGRIQSKACLDACHKAKEKGADIVKQWDSSLDKRTRKSHRELDGQIRELDEKFEVNGHQADAPRMFGVAKEDINCRCAMLQRARWAVGEVPATKWSEDAPIEISDDGTTQYVDISAKDYDDFKNKYKKASERVRDNAQKMKPIPMTEQEKENAIRTSIKKIEDEDRSLEYECGAVIGKDGTVLKRYKGTEHAVEVSDDDLKMMEGCTFTHNHPLGVFFSNNDIKTGFTKTKLAELRATTPQGITYVLKSNGNTTESANAFIQGYNQARMKANRNAQKAILDRVKMGEITLDDYKRNYYAYYRQYEDEMLVKYAENHAEEYGFIFKVEKNE